MNISKAEYVKVKRRLKRIDPNWSLMVSTTRDPLSPGYGRYGVYSLKTGNTVTGIKYLGAEPVLELSIEKVWQFIEQQEADRQEAEREMVAARNVDKAVERNMRNKLKRRRFMLRRSRVLDPLTPGYGKYWIHFIRPDESEVLVAGDDGGMTWDEVVEWESNMAEWMHEHVDFETWELKGEQT